MSKFTDYDVLDEGFTPLRKAPTEPQPLSSGKRESFNRLSFYGEQSSTSIDERQKEQSAWVDSSWSKLERSRGRGMSHGRSNSFFKEDPMARVVEGVEGIAIETIKESKKDMAVAIVDPFSTGAHLAAGVCAMGYKCIRIFSIWDSPVAALVMEGVNVDFDATVQHNDTEDDQNKATDDTVDQLKQLPFPIVAVLPGAETGVELADRLSARMGLRSNGESGSLARRNKYYMGEAVREAGVRAVKQKFCTEERELHLFLADLEVHQRNKNEAFKCVVKPVQSAGTDDVFLCDTKEEAITAFKRIKGKINGLGLYNDGALAQEFLKGKSIYP
jgi:hypothetical protein